MSKMDSTLCRRRFLQGSIAVGAVGAIGFLAPEVFAEELMGTPPLTEGPFYPDKLPLDTDNDLIIVNNSITPAVGEVTHLSGRVLDAGGSPVKDVTVEIWQCDARQVYLNTRDSEAKASQRDPNFQGFGRFTTGSKGEYRFRTIKPVAYPGRPAPHIHFKLKRRDRELLTTQLMIRGYAGNERDGVFRGVRDLVDRELIVTDFKPIKESKIGELVANFDIVLGRTPDERDFGR